MKKLIDSYDCTIKLVDGVKHFFVSFADINHHKHTIEVEKYVFDEFQKSKVTEKRQQNHFDRHLEHISLSDEELHNRSTQFSELTDDEVSHKILNDELYSTIDDLPEPLRKRSILYFIYELTYKQIAELENRSISSIRDSIDSAKLKITDALKKYFD